MTPLEFLEARRSVPAKQLAAPAPSAREQDALLALAVRVPDHGRLVPFRFVRIEGDARLALGAKIAEISRRRSPGAPDAVIEKDRGRFAQAPLVLTVVARLTPGHKVPEQEQLLSAGAVCMNLLLGAQAMGYGAQWLTAWMAYDRDVGALFGLGENERIVGFVHVGTPTAEAPERERPDARGLVADFRA